MIENSDRKTCDVCGQTFDSDQKLEEHRRAVHLPGKRSSELANQEEDEENVA